MSKCVNTVWTDFCCFLLSQNVFILGRYHVCNFILPNIRMDTPEHSLEVLSIFDNAVQH